MVSKNVVWNVFVVARLRFKTIAWNVWLVEASLAPPRSENSTHTHTMEKYMIEITTHFAPSESWAQLGYHVWDRGDASSESDPGRKAGIGEPACPAPDRGVAVPEWEQLSV